MYVAIFPDGAEKIFWSVRGFWNAVPILVMLLSDKISELHAIYTSQRVFEMVIKFNVRFVFLSSSHCK
jgi:hypothetical protein